MAAPILAEAQVLPADEIEALCQRLVDAFNTSVEQEDAVGVSGDPGGRSPSGGCQWG